MCALSLESRPQNLGGAFSRFPELCHCIGASSFSLELDEGEAPVGRYIWAALDGVLRSALARISLQASSVSRMPQTRAPTTAPASTSTPKSAEAPASGTAGGARGEAA